MNSERIKEIQEATAHPHSVSVQQALLQVWNECQQESNTQNALLKKELDALRDEIKMKTDYYEDKCEKLYINYSNSEKELEEAKADKKYTYEDMMNIAGFCAAMDSSRPVEHLKEEAIEYLKNYHK